MNSRARCAYLTYAILICMVAGATWSNTWAQNVTTWHNDNSRTGQNLKETVLTTANVNSTTFGKRVSFTVDKQILAQPLFVANVTIPGMGKHNVVYAATENDSVYAFDARGKPTTPLWQVNFTDSANGITAVPCQDNNGCEVGSTIGITGTPVIDTSTKTMYVVAFTKENGAYVQRLHALDITTGGEKFGGPAVIQATVPGTGDGSVNGMVSFDPLRHNQRPGLLLLNGVVYIAWASFSDTDPYHGWVIGYSASTLAQVAVYNATANGSRGGIWQGAGGISADTRGNIYVIAGNGTFDVNSGGADYGDSFLKLSDNAGLAVADYFTPFDEATLEEDDLDLGAGTSLILPRQTGSFPNELISAGKEGIIYVVNRNNMGQFNANSNNIIQMVTGPSGGYHTNPAYWNGAIYFCGLADFLSRYTLTAGLLSTSPVSKSPTTYVLGANPSISANGTSNGIVWAIDIVNSKSPGVLHAYDATDVSKELYNTSQNSTRDSLGTATHFSTPTIAKGQVYVGTTDALVVYGVLSH